MSLEWFIEIIVNNWPMFLRGAWMTLLIATVGTIFGALIGLIIGIIHTIPKSKSRIKRVFLKCVSIILSVYVEFFRGTPMIVQAMVVYFGSDLIFHIDMNRTFAAMFIVSVNTGAYMAEIVRGGIISIDNGQFEAARAIGMNHWQTMVHVVLPQVMRNILPATSNQYIMNIKDTSVLNVIGVTELFFQTKTIAGNNFRYFESFFVACILYMIMNIIVTQILRYFERKLAGNATYQLIDNQEMLNGQKAS